MAQIGLPYTLVAGTPEDVSKVQGNFVQIRDHINNALIGTDNLTAAGVTAAKLADAAKLGLTDGATIRRGKSIITTEEARTNVAYGLMTTPDQVSSVLLPTDGLIFVTYQAEWKSSVANAGLAAIFLGSNQVRIAKASFAAPDLSDGPITTTTANRYTSLFSRAAYGLFSESTAAAAYTGDVTTGQVLGQYGQHGSGPVGIFAAAGTYDVSVQFNASSGSVTAKNRKLWVWTMGF